MASAPNGSFHAGPLLSRGQGWGMRHRIEVLGRRGVERERPLSPFAGVDPGARLEYVTRVNWSRQERGCGRIPPNRILDGSALRRPGNEAPGCRRRRAPSWLQLAPLVAKNSSCRYPDWFSFASVWNPSLIFNLERFYAWIGHTLLTIFRILYKLNAVATQPITAERHPKSASRLTV